MSHLSPSPKRRTGATPAQILARLHPGRHDAPEQTLHTERERLVRALNRDAKQRLPDLSHRRDPV